MENKKELNIGDLGDAPNDKYKKLFEQFDEIETLDPSKWKTQHILGYFVKKYKEQYNTKYQFKFNSPTPSKCFEIFQVKKLASMLTSNPSLLKEYIDWVYETKVVKAKRKLTSISFMTNEGVVNEYKLNYLFANKSTIDRSTNLPDKYKNILETHGYKLNTYGDLAFLMQADPRPLTAEQALSNMRDIGFDENILQNIK